MAIEKVGGARAYVIKGNTNPQAKAQYWANLVTQEKYKLWETAQQEALSQMKQEELEYQTEADIYKAQVKGLQDFRRQNERELTKLQLKQAGASPNVSTTSGTRTIREGGGSTANAVDRDLKDIRDVAGDIADLKAEIALKGGAGLDMTNQQKAVENNKSYLETKMDKIEASNYSAREKAIAKNQIRKTNEDYGLGMDVGAIEVVPAAEPARAATTTTVPYTTTRTTGGLSEEEQAALQKRIDELRAEIEVTQAQERELVAPTLNRTGLLQRTREVLAEDLQPRERVPRSLSMSPTRRAELEALGVDQEFVDETTQGYDVTLPEETPAYVEPLPRPVDTRQMEMEAMGLPAEPPEFYETPPATRQEVRQAQKETEGPDAVSGINLDEIPEFKLPSTEGQKAAVIRPEITYKREVITDAGKEDALKVLEAEKRPEWVNIVERLYTPTKNQTPQQRAELLKNAWDEITLAYSEDRETMKKAHTLLVAVDKNYNKKQTPE